jgi:signal transduction histidine kinase
MHQLIEKLFKKRGINDVNDLSEEEKRNFDEWQGALTKEQLTPNDIKEFLGRQISVIESKWQDLTMENAKKAELIPYHTVYTLLLRVIDSPLESKKQIEQLLENLINN